MNQPLILCRTAASALVTTLPTGHDPAGWHAALTAEINTHLGPHYAACLAEPRPGPGGVEWATSGEGAIAAVSLPAADRAALMTALAAILSEIGRLAATGQAPALAAAWPAMRRIPDTEFIYAVDGRPVLAGWGHMRVGGLNEPDPLASLPIADGASAIVAPLVLRRRLPWPWIAVAAALALVVGLLIPALAVLPHQCQLPPATVAAIARTNHAAATNSALMAHLAEAAEAAGPQLATAPPLPKQAWDQGKLSMLGGCWHLISPMKVTHIGQHHLDTYTELSHTVCFDRSGVGEQTVTLSNGTSCSGPLRANFGPDHKLIVTEPARCTGPGNIIYTSRWVCTRTSVNQAGCVLTDNDPDTPPSLRGASEPGIFKR
ncbi:MAG: hypothetical protein PHT60_11555 [Acidiphilium sp.]|nr:hypothetical protein [Acidiphilium sp.]MDD4936399.1 hypothetical protein [Acidiphilium sp.]